MSKYSKLLTRLERLRKDYSLVAAHMEDHEIVCYYPATIYRRVIGELKEIVDAKDFGEEE